MTEPAPEFSRMVDRRQLRDAPVVLEAGPQERAALAERFGIVAIHALAAEVTLVPDGEAVDASGRLHAEITQACAVSGEDIRVTIDEKLAMRFVPERPVPDEEIELEEDQLDEIAYQGTDFDLGEAVAQSLALAIDPFATGPDADRVRQEQDLAEKPPSGPLQEALARLKKD